MNPTLILTPIRQAAPATGGTLEVLIRLQAPDQPPAAVAQRKPLRLAVVVDRSGSMSGQPLDEALRCAEYIARGLTPADQLAVVLYDNKVQVPVPLRPGGDAAAVRAALAGVESGGNTALFAGWEQGAKILEGGNDKALSRVLLLSDGQANEGLTDLEQIQKHCAVWAARGVSTTTVGLGRDFNEDLMIGMARAGAGQHYYGQTAEDLHDSFDEELALLQALYLKSIAVKLAPGPGVVAEPLGLVQPALAGGHKLPDLAWSAETWMLVRLHIAPNPAADPRQPQALLAVTVTGCHAGLDPASLAFEGQRLRVEPAMTAGQGHQDVELHAMLSLPLIPVSDLTNLPEDPLVAKRLQEIQFAEATTRIRVLAESGDIKAAKRQLAHLQASVANHPWLADKVAALSQLLERDALMSLKEMRYSSARSGTRLVAKQEAAYSASEIDSVEIPAFLRRKASEGQGRKR